MNIFFNTIKVDTAVAFHTVSAYLTNGTIAAIDKIKNFYSNMNTPDNKSELDILIDKYCDLYDKCKKTSDLSIANGGPVVTFNDRILNVEVSIDKPLKSKNGYPQYAIREDSDLYQLNMSDRHTALRLMNYTKELTELKYKILQHMPKDEIVINNRCQVFTGRANEHRPGISRLINDISETISFQDSELSSYLQSESSVRMSRARMNDTTYTLFNYLNKSSGSPQSMLVVNSQDTPEQHFFLNSYKQLGDFSKGVSFDDVIRVESNPEYKIDAGPLYPADRSLNLDM